MTSGFGFWTFSSHSGLNSTLFEILRHECIKNVLIVAETLSIRRVPRLVSGRWFPVPRCEFFEAQVSGDRFWNAIWPIHAAKLGESPITARTIDWVTSLTGLGLALLGFYGLWSFAFKARARRKIGPTMASNAKAPFNKS